MFDAGLNEFANFVGVVDAAEDSYVEIWAGAFSFLTASASAPGGFDLEVRDAKGALDRTLGDADVLDIREGDRHFLDGDDAFADAEATVGDDIPAFVEIETENGKGKQALNEEGE